MTIRCSRMCAGHKSNKLTIACDAIKYKNIIVALHLKLSMNYLLFTMCIATYFKYVVRLVLDYCCTCLSCNSRFLFRQFFAVYPVIIIYEQDKLLQFIISFSLERMSSKSIMSYTQYITWKFSCSLIIAMKLTTKLSSSHIISYQIFTYVFTPQLLLPPLTSCYCTRLFYGPHT